MRHDTEIIRKFWKPEAKGYTYNLNDAGKFSFEYINEKGFRILSQKENKSLFLTEDDIAIPENRLDLIGRLILGILK